MYINYEKLADIFSFSKFRDFFYNKKIEQNLQYIKKNKKNVLKKLKNKKHFRCAFYVYDSAKWKCQRLYDLMDEDSIFTPFVFVTKNAAKNSDNPSYQTKNEIENTFNFFKKRNMNVVLGYDFDCNKHIPLKNFEPDIVIYQHPWYIETSQGPVVASKYALTYYVPYDIPTTNLESDWGLRFHLYVQNFVVFNKKIENLFKTKMKNKGKNLCALGLPTIDFIKPTKTEDFVIYAPHWTINHEKTIAYSTFQLNGKFMLQYAKNHPEFNWVFKPHPMLKKAIIDNNLMTKEEVDKYYLEWEKLGKSCFDCEYLDLFNRSKLLITDCSTFLIEYFLEEKPLIHLVPQNEPNFNDFALQITKNYIKTKTLEELEKNLNDVLFNDTKIERKIFEGDFIKNSSERIIQHILKTVEY